MSELSGEERDLGDILDDTKSSSPKKVMQFEMSDIDLVRIRSKQNRINISDSGGETAH
jgi:hypothetical protein